MCVIRCWVRFKLAHAAGVEEAAEKLGGSDRTREKTSGAKAQTLCLVAFGGTEVPLLRVEEVT
jgi:hypothetical protein